MAKHTLTAADIFNITMDIPLTRERRTPHSRKDFGDEGTVRLHLRALIEGLPEPFGVYFGEANKKFVVGLMPVTSFDIVGGLAYDTLAELKEEWELD